MKICRFDNDRIGVVRDGHVHDVTNALEMMPPQRYPFAVGDQFIAFLPALLGHMERLAQDAPTKPIGEVALKSPVANPSKIIGTPVNYRAHVEEAQRDPDMASYAAGQRGIEEQGLFLKAASSLVGPSQGVRVRFPDRRTDHEAELGVIIGRKTGPVSEADALGVVAGYAIALDMSVRGKEDRSLRKSPDTYAVLGPWLVTPDELGNPDELEFSLRLNGELKQTANTREMIIGIARQIAWASSWYTLYPGDIIMTGTCQGVGPVKPGDVMTVAFERIGEMTVKVEGATS